MSNQESDDYPHSLDEKGAKLERDENMLVIYRKNDALKKALYPMDTNFSIKHAFCDLFPC